MHVPVRRQHAVLDEKRRRSRPCASPTAVSSGNEADLDLADYLNFVVDDPHTKQIVLFIEGIRRPQAFMRAAGRALAAGKPVHGDQDRRHAEIAWRPRNPIPARSAAITPPISRCANATASSIAARSTIFSRPRSPSSAAGCRRVRVSGSSPIPAAPSTCFTIMRNPKTPWCRTFNAATNEALMPHMQEGISPKNPLDTGIPSTLKAAVDQCAIVARDPNIDIVAWCVAACRARSATGATAHELPRLLTVTDKPVVAFGRMIHQMSPDGLAIQEQAGFPFLQGLEPTLRALNGLWFHAQRRAARPPCRGRHRRAI